MCVCVCVCVRMIRKSYGSSWSVRLIRIKLIRTASTDQVNPYCSVKGLRINLIHKSFTEQYGSTWSIEPLQINLIHKRLTDQGYFCHFTLSTRYIGSNAYLVLGYTIHLDSVAVAVPFSSFSLNEKNTNFSPVSIQFFCDRLWLPKSFYSVLHYQKVFSVFSNKNQNFFLLWELKFKRRITRTRWIN